ncbi:MAG TPA: FAD-dependent oxidoreductase [Solirubrobacteraceae bacterium]|jgi:predicted NAD/FAD-binding protein|nr:FAD-dependent oxidoreductase [Solirubrobacteraceae bacterium]
MRVAIVGAGVSGLVAAHLLHREHEIVLYEAGSYAGGHTNTIRVDTAHETHQVDTGFIVMNDRNYPNFTRLLERLGVATQPTHMSFSVKGEEEDFEYCGTPRGIFCQPSNLVSVRFQRMIVDLLRFNRALRTLLAREHSAGAHGGETLGDFLERGRFSRPFVERLIVPQVSAVWSADPRTMHTFPVRFLAEFFANHGMLGFRDRPQWATVRGGSARYVDALTAPFRERIRLNAPVHSIARHDEHVELSCRGSAPEQYDQVVIATHSDQALTMLSDPSEREAELLGAIPYQRNEAVLHTDSSLLPRRRSARAAWNFHLLHEPKPLSTVTYYMNHLQRLKSEDDFCVTLNRSEAIDPAKVIRTIDYSHPVYTPAGVAAQAQHETISGLHSRTHYCGAYWGWGFHEDGVKSALQACEPFGVTL